ncbi:MAG: PAS domain S-box protein [Terriglobales bacterium]
MSVSTARTMLVSTISGPHRDFPFPEVFDAAAIGVALCHSDGRILEGNAALARLLCRQQAELAGLDPWKFDEGDSPCKRRLTALLLEKSGSFALEMPFHLKDGSQFRGRVTVSLARESAFFLVLLEDVSASTHVTEQLRHAEKMNIIGSLAVGMAHDFHHVLTSFLLYCDLLLAGVDANDPLRRRLEHMRQNESSASNGHNAIPGSLEQTKFESAGDAITSSPDFGGQP